MRLQKYMAQQGLCSRSQAERLIDQGRVFVDGKIALLGDQVEGGEHITVDGRELVKAETSQTQVKYFHKPTSVECTLAKISGAVSLADYTFGADRFFPVGYLDVESHGLILMTNDGDLAHTLSEKATGLSQQYRAVFSRKCSEGDLFELTKALQKIDAEVLVALEYDGDALMIETNTLRSKDIRRVLHAYGLEDLCRTMLSGIALGECATGEIVDLSPGQIDVLKSK